METFLWICRVGGCSVAESRFAVKVVRGTEGVPHRIGPLTIPVHENGLFGVRKAEKHRLVHENGLYGVREAD